jgi:hypothetical protein
MAVITKVIPWFSTIKLLVKSSTERLNNRNDKYNLLVCIYLSALNLEIRNNLVGLGLISQGNIFVAFSSLKELKGSYAWGGILVDSYFSLTLNGLSSTCH